MSCYLYLFLKKDSVFIPLYSADGSNYLSELFHNAPYGLVRPFSREALNDLINQAVEEIVSYQTSIDKEKEKISVISNFLGNSVQDKLEAIGSCYDYIEELKFEMQHREVIKNFLEALYTILMEGEYIDGVDPDKYLYAGFECEYEITGDMITE